MKFIKNYLNEVNQICNKIDALKLEKIIQIISDIKKKKGRIFFIGVGGSAGNCSHAVNDFRKLANIECYAPTDNSSELTARINDDGWEYVFKDWLKVSRPSSKDLIFFLSVGGGSRKRKISTNLIVAAKFASLKKIKIISILGRSDGYLAKNSTVSLVVPCVNKNHITPHSESWQTVIWHLIISHPRIKETSTKW
jgi:D-sedoheptulose 7-phosphate isomerase